MSLVSIFVYSVVLFYFFFFFKQKTAYEMRISDWSSDVCSSDLMSDALAALLIENGFATGDRLALFLQNTPHFVIGMIATWKVGGVCVPEIGRASCRERVCQYV